MKVSLLGAAVTSVFMANVGHEGGKIRHPEITGATPSQERASGDAKGGDKNEDPSPDKSDEKADRESNGDEP